MNKLIITFTVAYFFMALIGGIVDGNSAYASTRLTADVDETPATGFTVSVRNTSGFDDAGYIEIDNEQISYSGKTDTTFTNCIHGWNSTDAASHIEGSMVYSADTGVLNAALGFTVLSTGGTAGTIDVMSFCWNFLTKSVPKLISWDFNYLKEGPLQFLRYFLLCISAGFLFIMAYMMISALGGIAQSIFVR